MDYFKVALKFEPFQIKDMNEVLKYKTKTNINVTIRFNNLRSEGGFQFLITDDQLDDLISADLKCEDVVFNFSRQQLEDNLIPGKIDFSQYPLYTVLLNGGIQVLNDEQNLEFI